MAWSLFSLESHWQLHSGGGKASPSSPPCLPAAVPPPPPSGLRLLPMPKVRGPGTQADARWGSRPRAVSSASAIPSRHKATPQPRVRVPMLPPTPTPLLSGGLTVAPRNTQETIPLGSPQGWHGLRTAWSISQEHRSARKRQRPICQPAQQNRCLQPNSTGRSLPQGPLPQAQARAALPGPGATRSHLRAGRSGAWGS